MKRHFKYVISPFGNENVMIRMRAIKPFELSLGCQGPTKLDRFTYKFFRFFKLWMGLAKIS